MNLDIFGLFPATCHICGMRLPRGRRFLCTGCEHGMPRTSYHLDPDNGMVKRFAGRFQFERATAHLFYSRGSRLATLIRDLKYHSFPGIGVYLGELAAGELRPDGFFDGIDVIMPVPMHFIKQARRGYNQAAMIARGLSRVTGLPVSDDLRATRGHKTQTSLTLEMRRLHLEGIFRLAHAGRYEGLHILLVDDVCTTGSTLSEAAQTVTATCRGAKLSLLTIGVTF